uniref:Uncharacterized protein n=1 Tax=Ciona savignyi TaxID=51511 RepID=H2YBV6_CIOSA
MNSDAFVPRRARWIVRRSVRSDSCCCAGNILFLCPWRDLPHPGKGWVDLVGSVEAQARVVRLDVAWVDLVDLPQGLHGPMHGVGGPAPGSMAPQRGGFGPPPWYEGTSPRNGAWGIRTRVRILRVACALSSC